ncbi:DUF479 domain-containing protein [Wenzhouxiangella sp. AB-CW3]|uniref:acyl carrier protein phosphodiesterase n=1 Tax=Wenzhouxiangella sp. AB-CW3 TaxID=2771012 RepID=UPI00168B7D61|nr:ACP phosphodiesterase [Wenzhouxiangella sp. AB-CW3]QOC22206.1 DUF479 domain-containing protein [Wenzhouxiangella sp. AB-CW3]
MNHLAHVVLAGSQEGLRLGAFLGDHVRGRRALSALPPDWAAGVMLHRRIDTLSDSHPAVRALLARFHPPWRRYAGVIVDVLFDYMLSRHWDRFGPAPLGQLSAELDDLLARHAADLPARLVRFSRWARARRLWMRYGDKAMLDEIFYRLAQRHGRPGPLADGIEVLSAREREIESTFLKCFPDLVRQAGEERLRLQSRWSSM